MSVSVYVSWAHEQTKLQLSYMNSFSLEISQCRSVFYIMSQSKKKSKLFERKEEKMTVTAKSTVVLGYKNNTVNEWARLGNRKIKLHTGREVR